MPRGEDQKRESVSKNERDEQGREAKAKLLLLARFASFRFIQSLSLL